MATPGDADFRSSLTRYAGSAVGLIVAMAAIFWVIGSIGDDEPAPTAATNGEADDGAEPGVADGDADADPPAAAPEEPDDATDDDEADEVDDPEPAEADDAGEPEPESDDADGDEADPDDEGDADADEPDADEADSEPEPEEPAAPRIDPASISVQVLDGYQADGGTAANGVAQQLADAGYDIIARNPALRYDVTTVLWSPGFEDEGRQVAADIGAAEARQQPGNLSSSVAVHVVVGADRG